MSENNPQILPNANPLSSANVGVLVCESCGGTPDAADYYEASLGWPKADDNDTPTHSGPRTDD